MPSEAEPAYGQSTAWRPERPRFRLFPLVVSWLATGVALMVAAGLLPGVSIDGFWGALLVAAIVAALNAVIPPVLAALRLPPTLVLGFLLVLLADAGILLLTDALTDGILTRRRLRLGAARRARRRRGERRARRPPRLGRHVLAAHRAADRAPAGHHRRAPTSPGSSSSRSTGSRCPCCAGRCATATPRPWRAGWPRTRTAWPSGRPTSPRRRAPARRGSCWAPTRTSRRSAGWRRRPRR